MIAYWKSSGRPARRQAQEDLIGHMHRRLHVDCSLWAALLQHHLHPAVARPPFLIGVAGQRRDVGGTLGAQTLGAHPRSCQRRLRTAQTQALVGLKATYVVGVPHDENPGRGLSAQQLDHFV